MTRDAAKAKRDPQGDGTVRSRVGERSSGTWGHVHHCVPFRCRAGGPEPCSRRRQPLRRPENERNHLPPPEGARSENVTHGRSPDRAQIASSACGVSNDCGDGIGPGRAPTTMVLGQQPTHAWMRPRTLPPHVARVSATGIGAPPARFDVARRVARSRVTPQGPRYPSAPAGTGIGRRRDCAKVTSWPVCSSQSL